MIEQLFIQMSFVYLSKFFFIIILNKKFLSENMENLEPRIDCMYQYESREKEHVT